MSKEIQKREETDTFDTREVVTTLNGLMKRVTQEQCNAETVNAACNCAARITDLLKVHLDVERLRKKFER